MPSDDAVLTAVLNLQTQVGGLATTAATTLTEVQATNAHVAEHAQELAAIKRWQAIREEREKQAHTAQVSRVSTWRWRIGTVAMALGAAGSLGYLIHI